MNIPVLKKGVFKDQKRIWLSLLPQKLALLKGKPSIYCLHLMDLAGMDVVWVCVR